MAMSFDDKLSYCIRNLDNIDKPDYPQKESNYYVDFIELLALFAGKDGITYGEILDRFFGEPDDKTTIDGTDISSEYLPSEKNDTNESFLDGLFLLIGERIVQYGNLYPFMMIDEFTFVLKEELSDGQKLYLFLLLSSSLDIFSSFNAELTTDFESLAYETMQMFLPNAIVKPFGKNTEYRGTAKEKIRQLAKDIGLPTKDYELNQIGERNVQERGLDVVGWLPFNDNCQNIIVFLCQCACGKNFEYKQHDIRRFKHYYEFYRTAPQHTLFIPYSLINPKEGKFYNSDLIDDDYLIFERMRILNLVKDEKVFGKLKSKKIVEECIKILQNN